VERIHLPANAPTDLIDKSKFGTGDDDSNLGAKKYYMSDTNLPWAINFSVQFALSRRKTRYHKSFFNIIYKWTKQVKALTMLIGIG
jgi:LruC domain-containing protein